MTAAGQIVEDGLSGSRSILDRVTDAAPKNGPAAITSRTVGGLAATRRRFHRTWLARSGLDLWRNEIVALSVALAVAALGYEPAPGLAERVAVVARPVPALEEVGNQLARIPSCFRSFPQHPDDIVALVHQYLDQRGADRAGLVVGVRTSGSYLGALAAAELSAAAETVPLITLRPGEGLDEHQMRCVTAARDRDILVLDDPPVSGTAVSRVLDTLRDSGADPKRILLLLGTDNDTGELPEKLDAYRRHVLPGPSWALRRRLASAESMGQELEALMAPRSVGEVEIASFATSDVRPDVRSHIGVRLQAKLGAPQRSGGDPEFSLGTDRERLDVLAQSIGIGFFGRHALGVAQQLGDAVPTVLGFRDGVLFQALDEHEPAVPAAECFATIVGGYAARRREALPVATDKSLEIHGHQALWEVAAEMAGRATGRFDLVLRLPVLNPMVRRILASPSPSIVDARMAGPAWLAGPGAYRKLHFAEGAFSSRDLVSYDAAFDIASAARVGHPLDEIRGARETYERLSGDRVSHARWLLLRLVHAWDQRRSGELDQLSWGPEVSRLLAEFLGGIGLDANPTASPTSGDWVITDVDGVLETAVMGASAPGRAGTTALHALRAHGKGVVLATGRGANDVAARVQAWALPGAVAEYGATLVMGDGSTPDLRSPQGAEAIERLRRHLDKDASVVLDPTHVHTVRALRRTEGGALGPLTDSQIRSAIDRCGGPEELVAVPGEDQTDFVPAGVSKLAAAEQLLERLGVERNGAGPAFALAVGDGPADLAMLRAANLGVAPKHAAEVFAGESGITVSSGAYQSGLADAASRLIGHRPGTCATCSLDLGYEDSLMLDTLSVREAGTAGSVLRAARIVSAVARYLANQDIGTS